MTLTFDNGVVQLYHGSALDMAFLADESVDMVCTSPPYWGLRDYSLEPTVWDAGDGCEHAWRDSTYQRRSNDGGDGARKQETSRGSLRRDAPVVNSFCALCPAWRGTLGLEPDPTLYVQHLVQVFREVWRVLRPCGTVFLNLGDSYAGSGGAHNYRHGNPGISQSALRGGVGHQRGERHPGPKKKGDGPKPKDLVLIPERVALALQDDGWWVRSRIAWCKTAPMPESVDDRPTSAWEHIWLLAKAEDYFWDREAVRAPLQADSIPRSLRGRSDNHKWALGRGPGNQTIASHLEQSINPAGRNMRNWWVINPEPMGWEMCESCGMIYDPSQYRRLGRLVATFCDLESREEKTKTYVICKRCDDSEAWMSHFAAFPQALVEPCILAGTSETGNCAKCGQPWERVVERKTPSSYEGKSVHIDDVVHGMRMKEKWNSDPETTDWRPTCSCDADTVSAMVLDPFVGSGTACLVAQKLGRRAIGVDQSEAYLVLAQARIEALPLPMVMM